nr:type I-E CRISPR-associated protein Cas6/Cse3/CasE [Streptomyces himalayensis]
MTATLTRIRLNLRSPDVRRDLAHTDSLHKTVMLLAPDHLGDNPRQQTGLLFRLERGTHPMPPTLLVQSHQPPTSPVCLTATAPSKPATSPPCSAP